MIGITKDGFFVEQVETVIITKWKLYSPITKLIALTSIFTSILLIFLLLNYVAVVQA